MKAKLNFIFWIAIVFFLWSCGFLGSEGRVYIDSSEYRYRSLSSKTPSDIADAIAENGESKILLVACPTATSWTISPLQQILSMNSKVAVQLVFDKCA